MAKSTNEIIKEIAEQMDCGFRCFIKKDTRQLIFVPDTDNLIEIDTSAWDSELKELDANFDKYLEIESMSSHESFSVMEQFINSLDDLNSLKKQLWDAINRPKPFRQFKFIIDQSGQYRQQWFDFKNAKNREWVKRQIEIQTS